MARPLVYLAGAIAGLSGHEATDWRLEATDYFLEYDIETLDPMRGKDKLADAEKISNNFKDYRRHGAFYTASGIMTRDHNDVCRADALLVNLLGLKKPSLGTVMELAWAFHLHKPAIVCIEETGNPHDNHPMISAAMHFRVTSLEDGIIATAVILNR